jgi:hypothetical protein
VTYHHIDFIALKVREGFSERRPNPFAELLGEPDLEFGIVLIRDTLCYIIVHLAFCKTMTEVPQEGSRVQQNQAEIDEFSLELGQNVSGPPSIAVYNVGEVGFDSWVDATRVPVIVPMDYESTQIGLPITKSDARATMVACITANGH